MGGGEAANKVGNLKYSVKDGRMRPRGLDLDGYRRGGSVFLIPRLVSSYGASYFYVPNKERWRRRNNPRRIHPRELIKEYVTKNIFSTQSRPPPFPSYCTLCEIHPNPKSPTKTINIVR